MPPSSASSSEWKRYNQSLSELSRLGDRELADIGISRSDIQRVAWNAAHPTKLNRIAMENARARRGRFRLRHAKDGGRLPGPPPPPSFRP